MKTVFFTWPEEPPVLVPLSPARNCFVTFCFARNDETELASLQGGLPPKQYPKAGYTQRKINPEPGQSFLWLYSLLSLFLAILFSPAKAQLSDWEVGGYVKNLFTYNENLNNIFPGLVTDFGQFQNTFQGRLNIFWYPFDNLYFSLQSRHLLIYQKNIKTLNSFTDIFSDNTYYFDLKYEYADKNDFYAYSEIDRLYLDWTIDALQVTIGRQRIAWGTCLVWNPSDLFNPFNFLDFDYEERPGTDALLLQYYTGPVSQIALAVSPGKTKEQVVYTLRYQTNYENYDFSLQGGWQKQTLRLSFTWAGQLWDAGFRGEILYSDPDLEYTRFDPALPPFFFKQKTDKPYWTGALSLDYTFSNSLYLHGEYLYNGLGTRENAALRRWDILYTGELTPARQSAFLHTAYDITPLLRGDIFLMANPDDRSGIVGPSLQYSLATNWDLYALAFLTYGATGTEFGGFPNQYFLRIKFSF